MRSELIVGTRGSKLATAQANIAAGRLEQANPSCVVKLKTITTGGDRNQTGSLTEIGGKGLFIKELEQSLLDGTIDIAVHSFKDITTQVPPGLELCSFFRPESSCDVLISRGNMTLDQLPNGARIGTGSMRRRALLLRLRPDLEFVDIRGNIDTRMAKLNQGVYDGIILSEAGLIRLGLERKIAQRFDQHVFYPAPGQGVVALEVRRKDTEIRDFCLAAGDEDQRIKSLAELSMLSYLGFDCRTPLGVYTSLSNGNLSMRGFYVNPQTGDFIEQSANGPESAPEELGKELSRMFLQGRK